MTGPVVNITVYRWAGAWGPCKVTIPCGECSLTRDVIRDTLQHELAGIPVELEIFDWLSRWWKPLLRGGWHAPIVLVDNRVKPLVGPKTPITVPQIWLDSDYIGGADRLSERLQRDVEPNPERGQCSLSAKSPT